MGGGGSRRYDWETKVAASRDHVENGLTKTVLRVMRAVWAEMRHPLQEPVETLQLVQGRDGRPRA